MFWSNPSSLSWVTSKWNECVAKQINYVWPHQPMHTTKCEILAIYGMTSIHCILSHVLCRCHMCHMFFQRSIGTWTHQHFWTEFMYILWSLNFMCHSFFSQAQAEGCGWIFKPGTIFLNVVPPCPRPNICLGKEKTYDTVCFSKHVFATDESVAHTDHGGIDRVGRPKP